ncbi:MAG: T9SS type A sorting domain-containing protein [Brumimicrobium sp.]
MKHIFTLFFIGIIGFTNFSKSQCNEDSEVKILLVGDSWAFFMGVDGTINTVMESWGHSGNKFYTDLNLAQNGAKTYHFLEAGKQQILENELTSRPELEYVHLSLSGNDLLGNWKSQSFTQQQNDDLKQATLDSLDMVIQFIKGVRPDIDIVISGYAYPNFEEVVNSFGDPIGITGPEDHPFYSTWENMEFPSNFELNTQLNEFTDLVYNFYINDPKVHFVPATGITQYKYGQIDPLEVAPFGTYPEKYVPLPYGDPEYPSPRNSMRDYLLTKDCFHLSKIGYQALVGYTTQKYYHKAMMDDKYFIATTSQANGSVASDGTLNDQLFVGENAGVNHQTILSFETQNELDNIVDKASLFLHRIQQTGTDNPINGDIIIEIMDGPFGLSTTIEVSDYDVIGKAEGNPCVFGSNTDGEWVRLDLPTDLLEYIKPYDVTQFKISAPTANGSMVEFSGVDDPDFAPVLNIVYGSGDWSGLTKEEIKQSVVIYPNPANNIVNIDVDFAEVNNIEVYSVDGRRVAHANNTTINVSYFKAGTYFIKIVTDKGISTHKFVKE